MPSVFALSMKECKFPLARILRLPWQDEVITEWLAHTSMVGTHLLQEERERERSPNPRLPTWRAPGSRLIPQLQSHTHAFCSLRARTQAAGTEARHVSTHAPAELSFPVKHTYSQTLKACGMTALCRCVRVWEAIGGPSFLGIMIPPLIHWHTGGFLHAATYAA